MFSGNKTGYNFPFLLLEDNVGASWGMVYCFPGTEQERVYIVIPVNLGLLEILNQYVGKLPQLCKDNSEGKR